MEQSPSWEANRSRNSPRFMEPEGSIPHSQEPAFIHYIHKNFSHVATFAIYKGCRLADIGRRGAAVQCIIRQKRGGLHRYIPTIHGASLRRHSVIFYAKPCRVLITVPNFRHFRISGERRLLSSSCPSVRMCHLGPPPLDEFLWNFILKTFVYICRENPN
jgi:hypothetical protein